MIGSGVFDRHPKLQVLIIHMGGELASVLGRLEFTWRLNYKGIRNPPAGRPCKNERPPSDYFKTNILVDCMASTQLDCKPPLRCAVPTSGVRLRLRSDPIRDQRACADRRGRASEPG